VEALTDAGAAANASSYRTSAALSAYRTPGSVNAGRSYLTRGLQREGFQPLALARDEPVDRLILLRPTLQPAKSLDPEGELRGSLRARGRITSVRRGGYLFRESPRKGSAGIYADSLRRSRSKNTVTNTRNEV
jgi:hypothetical protein